MNMIRTGYFLLLTSLLILLIGCQDPNGEPAPTAFPPEQFPTIVVLTGRAAMATNLAGTPSVTPSETVAPSPTATATFTATPVPTDTPTASPSAPNAQIRIQVPGPMSKVTSPLALRMQVVSGDSELVQIDLQGEDGRLLARKLEYVKSWPGGYVVTQKIPFEILTAAEVGKITISTKDQFGRVQSLLSMRVLLLSVGEEEITPELDPAERAVFYNFPRKDAVALDGILSLEGRFLPFNDQPVVLELVSLEKKIVGLRVLDFIGTDEQVFSTTIPYKIAEPGPARLVLRQDDDRLDGAMYIYSREIMLYP